MSEIAFLSATELAARIRSREIGCEELLRHYLQRVDRYNGAVNAIVVDLREPALAAARAADRALASGKEVGPLHGVPMTVKESYNLAGAATTWGNPEWRGNIAKEDAESVKRLKAAGAVVFGKTNVPLMLADFQSYNEVYGVTNNPYNLGRIPGGSSGGSAAALAAGLVGLETGSDIGGSIRNPAHFCGVFGHKPTWNLLWMRGHAPPGDMRSTPDISVIGPLARSAADLETALQLMAGPDEITARGCRLELPTLAKPSLAGLKVAVWSDDPAAPVEAEVRLRVEQVAAAFRDGGAEIDFAARPDFDPKQAHRTYQNLLWATMAARMPAAEYRRLQQRAAALAADDDSDSARTVRAQVASFQMWKQNDEQRAQLRWRWHEFFKDYDLLLTPVAATAAFAHDHRPFGERTIPVNGRPQPYFDQLFWAGLTCSVYLPSTVIPTGLNDAGLPIGVQIAGPEYGDLYTIGAAKLLEEAGFRFRPPPGYLD